MTTEYEDAYDYGFDGRYVLDDGDDWPPYIAEQAVTAVRWRPLETVNLPEDDQQ